MSASYTNSDSNRNTNIMSSGRIVYVEPNNLTERVEYNPEDYSIFVDLTVETTDRYERKKTLASAMWAGSSLTFSGSKIVSTDRRYLTTNILNTTFYDVKEGNNTEGLCIDSIDISYNSWNCPEVNIKFTDIRGVSLLQPSDYYISEVDETWKDTNGDKVPDNGREIVKKMKNENEFNESLISSFFKFPYPRYRLRVKGFYGKPVAYQLCVTDFRTSFNSTTGNFDINVKFVGYMFGFLTDIPINFLFQAPYALSRDGKEYWDTRDFRFETGEKIPKFLDLRKQLQELTKNLESNGTMQKAQEINEALNTKKEQLESLKLSYTDFIDAFARIEVEVGPETIPNTEGRLNEKKKWYGLLIPQVHLKNTVVVNGVTGSTYDKIEQYLPVDINNTIGALCGFDDFVGDGEYKYLSTIIKKFKSSLEEKRGTSDSRQYKIGGFFKPVYSFYQDDKKVGYFTLDTSKIDGGEDVIGPTLGMPNFVQESLVWKALKAVLPNPETSERFEIIKGDVVKHGPNKKTLSEYVKTPGIKKNKNAQNINEFVGLSVLFICDTDIQKEFNEIESANNNDIKLAEAKIEDIKNSAIARTLGFTPTIKNVMDILLAHLDTGMHLLNTRIDGIYEKPEDRNAGVLGLNSDNCDINTNKSDKTFVPPFFTYYKNYSDTKGENTKDTVPKREEGWIGAVPSLENLPEANIVREYLKGVLQKNPEVSDLEEQIANINRDNSGDLTFILPTDFIHFSEDSNPYSNILNGNMDGPRAVIAIKQMFLYRLFVYEFFLRRGRLYNNYLKDPSNDGNKIVNTESTAFIKTPAYRNLGKKIIEALKDTKGKKMFEKYPEFCVSKLPSMDSGATSHRVYFNPDWQKILPTPERLSDIEKKNSTENRRSVYVNPTAGTVDDKTQFIINTDSNEMSFTEQCNAITGKYKGTMAVSYGYLNREIDDKVDQDGDDIWANYFNTKVMLDAANADLNKKNFENIKKLYDTGINVNKYDDALSAVKKSSKDFSEYNTKKVDSKTYLPFFGVNENRTLQGSGLLERNKVSGGQNKAFKIAYLFLNSLPLNYSGLVAAIKDKHLENKPAIISVSKALVLLTGALLWRQNQPSGDDILWGENKVPRMNQIPRCSGDPFMGIIEDPKSQKVYIDFDTSWMNAEIKEKFRKIFENWVVQQGGEWEKIYNTYFAPAQSGFTNTDVYFAQKLKNKNITVFINNNRNENMGIVSDLMTTEWTISILHPVSYLYSNTQKYSELSLHSTSISTLWDGFVDKILAQKEKDNERLKELENKLKETRPDVLNEDLYLSVYNLFKGLCNKWLLSMDDSVFRYNNGYPVSNTISNYFRYTNSYAEDIGQKLLVDVNDLKTIIENAMNKKVPSMSMYEFMYSIAAANDTQLLALPALANLGINNAQEFVDVFKPMSYAESIGRGDGYETENTYVFVYTERASHTVEMDKKGDYTYGYKGDEVQFVGASGLWTPEKAPQTFFTKGNSDEWEKAYCFGVTFAKDNQSYFKDIQVSMDNPKSTDVSIGTTIDLADRFGSKSNSQLVTYGQNLYTIYSSYSYQCTVKMMGCARIMPLMYFQLNNIPMFRGVYQIYNVKHSITPGNMVTTFTGQRISRNRTKYNEDLGKVIPAAADEGSGATQATTSAVGSGFGKVLKTGKPISDDEISLYKMVCRYAGLTVNPENEAKVRAIRQVFTNMDPGIDSLAGYKVPRQRFDPYACYMNSGSTAGHISIPGVTSSSYIYDSAFKCNSSDDCLIKMKAAETCGSTITKLCAFYGIWFIPGSDYVFCGGYKDIDEFIEDAKINEAAQSRQFGQLLKERNLANDIAEGNWNAFIRKYFHLDSTAAEEKKYLYATNGQTESTIVRDLANMIRGNITIPEESTTSNVGDIRVAPVCDTDSTDIPPFDVAAAINWLMNNAYPQYYPSPAPYYHKSCTREVNKCGLCASFTTSAMAAGGIPKANYSAEHAYQLIPQFTGTTQSVIINGQRYTPAQLWVEITNNVRESDNPNVPPNTGPNGCQPGDICIFEPGEGHGSGHMCMYLGFVGKKQNSKGEIEPTPIWASDFLQVNSWHGLKNPPKIYHIFRYKNRRSGSNTSGKVYC